MIKYNNYEKDCVHLHACRRLCLFAEAQGKRITRYCNKDMCTAYTEDVGFVPVNDAVSYARDGASSIRGGYDEYDVYTSEDLEIQEW